MSVLSELKTVLDAATDIPFETGKYTDVPEEDFGVILPLTDVYGLSADNFPEIDVQHARLEIFIKGNYMQEKKTITTALLNAGFTITGRGYVEYEQETGYHHFYIDVAQFYEMEDF